MTNLIHIPMNGRAFARWSEGRGLRDSESAGHAFVTGMFGRQALQPYRIFESDASWSIYGYSSQNADSLRQTAEITATPDMLEVLDLANLRHKAMPLIAAGTRVGFDVRFRPTRRSKFGEHDAFLADLERNPNVDRETSYINWFAERLAGAAEIETFRLTRSSLVRTMRKRQMVAAPDATAQGTVKVSDAEAFLTTLSRGVGRHLAFGMGMLLLRPADPPTTW